jgi:putative flippase GtrA
MMGHGRALLRTQATALLATLVDFGTLFFLTEVAGLYYVASATCGALLGAVTNYVTNRLWAFDHGHHSGVAPQAFRYAVVSAASLALNVGGVFLFTEVAGLRYGYSKAITSLAVALLWNYPLHRYFVFKEVTP